jgi:hypothetical protein
MSLFLFFLAYVVVRIVVFCVVLSVVLYIFDRYVFIDKEYSYPEAKYTSWPAFHNFVEKLITGPAGFIVEMIKRLIL